MKIALLTLGTRGDVQPYAILGQALQQRGHQVTLSTAKNFEAFIKSYDIDFVPVEADFQAIIESDEGKRMMKNPFTARKHLNNWVYPMIYNALKTFYSIAKESDLVLYHVKTGAEYFADQFPGKMVKANVIPAFQPTKAFVNPVVSGLSLPSFLNKWSYKLSAWGMKMMNTPIKKFRVEAGLPAKARMVHQPSIYGISNHFLQQPADYPADSYFTGFWTAPTHQHLAEDIKAFAQNGEPPLLVTFGSMPFQSSMNLPHVIRRITEELKTRVIVIKGWGLQDTAELEQHTAVKVIASAPYDQLIPLVKAVVHHGGIGTIASCLQAGKPFLVCPVLYPMGDQHFWGNIAWQKGVALKPAPLKKLTEDILFDKVKELLSTASLYQNSHTLMEKINAENGVRYAINIIEQLALKAGVRNSAAIGI